MTNITPISSKPMTVTSLSQFVAKKDLKSDIPMGMAVMSIQGGRFSIRYQGEDQPLVDVDQNGRKTAKTYLDIIMLRVSDVTHRQYFKEAFQPGVSAAPVCYSFDGIKPDASAPEPQHSICQGCAMDQFGSRRTQQGKDAKACSSLRRAAIVSAHDPKSERYGGPVLLRIPLMSIGALEDFQNEIEAKYGDLSYNAIVTRMSFDPTATFLRLRFEPVREVTDAEVAAIVPHYKTAVPRLLQYVEQPVPTEAAPVEPAPVEPAPVEPAPIEPVSEAPLEPAQEAAPPPAAKKRGRKPKAQKAETPAEPTVVVSQSISDLDAALGLSPTDAPPSPTNSSGW